MVEFDVIPPYPPNDGILFVDHSKANRSGHLGHALVEHEPGNILAFYSNNSDHNRGHSGDGWMEYRLSEDAGRTWSDPTPLPYSKQTYEGPTGRAVACEKAVATSEGGIVLFNLEYRKPQGKGSWHPHYEPTYLRSFDAGRTWDGPYRLCDEPGRIYEALYRDGVIYVLSFCNDTTDQFTGTMPEHVYRLYVSTDQGRTFIERSALPFNTIGRGYGTMAFLHDGSIIAYVYNINDEKHLDYVISRDNGMTWQPPKTAYFEKQIRNPQMASFKDGFILHGRSGSKGEQSIRGHFVLYTSDDGVTWDGGRYLRMQDAGHGAYSNNLLVTDPADGNRRRLLIQASHAYRQNQANVLHWWLE